MKGRVLHILIYFLLVSTVLSADIASYVATTTSNPEIAVVDLELLLRPLRRDELAVEVEAWFDLLQQKVREVSIADSKMKEEGRAISEKKDEIEEQIQAIKEQDKQPSVDPVAPSAETPKEAEVEEKILQKVENIEQNMEEITGAADEITDTIVSDINAVDKNDVRASEKDLLKKNEEVEEAKEKLKEAAAEISQSDGKVEDKVKKIGAAEIDLHAKIKEELLASLIKLGEEQAALIDRFITVTAAFEGKGGNIEEYELYVTAISGLKIDIKDVSAVRAFLRGWLKSPEGGIKWIKSILSCILVILMAKILSVVLGRVTRRASGGRHRRHGFIIGFALQGTLGNFAAGLMILVHRPYDVGDIVCTAGITGFVKSMNLNTTTIKTFDNQIVVVPNGSIWGDNIINVTGSDTRRVDMTFGIGYSDDIGKAQAILEDIVKSHALVLSDPEPDVKLHELGDSSVNFVCRPWAFTSDYWTVYWDVTRSVKERFDAANISIPFPQRDVHIIPESTEA